MKDESNKISLRKNDLNREELEIHLKYSLLFKYIYILNRRRLLLNDENEQQIKIMPRKTKSITNITNITN